MRKIVLSLAAAGAALIAASPAAAQYHRAPYGNAYGNNGFQMVQSLQVRIDNIQRQINRLDRRDRIGENSADRLRDEARQIERRLHKRARGGLDNREAGDLAYRVQRLEQRVQIALGNRYDRRDRRDRRW
jgi:cell division protein FtsB